MLDNIYAVNNPQRAVNANAIQNMDELINPTFGGTLRTNGNPNEIVADMVVPFIGDKALAILEHVEHIRENRGYPRSIGGLDPEVLQNQTATAVAEQKASATSKIELYARNLAETGMKRLFRCIYKLLCKHQDTPKFVRLRGELVEMNPKIWDADMDVSINVGLGAGSRHDGLATGAHEAGANPAPSRPVEPLGHGGTVRPWVGEACRGFRPAYAGVVLQRGHAGSHSGMARSHGEPAQPGDGKNPG
jgi:hypothetical protein